MKRRRIFPTPLPFGPAPLIAVVALLGVVLAGCGEDGGKPAADSGGAGKAFPAKVKTAAGTVVVKRKPTRIVSLSPTTTEMLYAIGAGKQVAAVDDQSNYPEHAPRTKLSGFKPNADAIAGYEPDLVVLSYDSNKVVDSLRRLKIPVYVAPAAKTLDDSYRQIKDLGTLTGRGVAAGKLVDRMKSEIDQLVADLPERDEPLTYYYELDPQLHSVTSKTFVGSVFELAGLRNIADQADTDGTGYPKLSAEHVIDSDPDLVFLADTKCCGQTAGKVAKRPGWRTLTAVKSKQVYELDDDIASRWGPRVVDLVRAMSKAVAAVPE